MTEELGLEREYRPNRLDTFTGNRRIKEEVKSVLAAKVRPHFILISGSSGLGKTTLARIIAKEVRCPNWNVHDGACDQCQSCKQFNTYIKTGNYDELPGFTEVDNGRYSKVEGVRALLDEFTTHTLPGVTRIAILDEIQTLSRAAQDAMLKTLEEPSENTLFIMCTTAPEYLQPTVVNRAKPHLILTRPTTPELVTYLANILTAEKVKYDTQGLEIIAARNDNIPRNSVISLEGVIAQRGEVLRDRVVDVLDKNNIADKVFFEFYNSLLVEDNKALYLNVIDRAKQVVDLNTFVDKLLAFTKRGLYIQNGVNIDGITKEEMLKYKRLFTQFSIGEVSNLLHHLVKLKRGDIETNLFVLGYTDLKATDIEAGPVLIADSEKVELGNEQKALNKNKQTRREEQEAENMKHIEELNKPATTEDIMSFFQSREVTPD